MLFIADEVITGFGRTGNWFASQTYGFTPDLLSMAKGIYHWAIVAGVIGPTDGFEYQPMPWQTATVFFAVIDLVAAVGLWLAAAWGAVVWLTACVSMAAVEVFFPQVYGGRLIVVGIEGVLLFSYLALAIQSAREHPN